VVLTAVASAPGVTRRELMAAHSIQVVILEAVAVWSGVHLGAHSGVLMGRLGAHSVARLGALAEARSGVHWGARLAALVGVHRGARLARSAARSLLQLRIPRRISP
jgi:hypothetical protein